MARTRRGGKAAKSKASSVAPPSRVGVGTRAPALAALRRVFAELATNTGASFLVAVGREAAEAAPSGLLGAIAEAAAMPVEAAQAGTRLAPNHVYIVPDGERVTIQAGVIRTAQAQPSDGRIDSPLISIAEASEEVAVIVVMVGLGAEGATAVARSVNIAVEPVQASNEAVTPMVLSQDDGPTDGGRAREPSGASDEHVQRLEAELRTTKERLQTTIEELQTVNGELAHRVGDLARANSDLKNLLESTQIATVFLDNDLRLRSFTPAASDVFHLIEADVGQPIGHVAARVDYPELQADARRVLKTLAPVERQVVSVENDRQFLVRVLPYRSVDNFIAGAVVTFLEITGTARAEAALRTSERRFSEAQQLAGIGVWQWNLDDDEVWWSPVVYRLWGLPAADGPPPRNLRPVFSEDREVYEHALAQARQTGELNVEWRVVLPDGSLRWLTEIGRMERTEGARRMLGIAQDITHRKQTETRLTLLLGELQHRVRNILGVVRSIVQRTVRSATSIEDLAAHLDGRLDALARTQGVLTRSGTASVELEEIIRDEMVAVAAREEQLSIEGPVVRLRREAAETLALALHELTTNAVKYGALSEPSGKISVTWRVLNTNRGKRLSLEWKEGGVRALDVKPLRSGFGRELIEKGLPYELGATTALEFARGGVRVLIELPLTERIAEIGADDESDDAEEREA